MKELNSDGIGELIPKIRELKEQNKRCAKDLRLTQNLKMLMRDFN
jgi:hypothetical protein